MKPSDFPWDQQFLNPQTPCFRSDDGTYQVFSYADIMRILRNEDQAFTRDPYWLPAAQREHPSINFLWVIEPFTLGGEEGRHTALRGIVEPWFRTRAVRTMEPVIREIARDLLTQIIAKGVGECDLAQAFAYRLAIRVICRLVGLPLEREGWLREKLNEISQATSYDAIPRQWDQDAYFWQIIAERLVRPQSELLDVLVEGWKDGKLSSRELLGYLVGFTIAGTDTTGTGIANMFSLLAEFECLNELANHLDNVSVVDRAIEEAVRFAPPFPRKPFFTLKQVMFGELVIPSGSVVIAWFAAANRDQAVNSGSEQTDPNRFDPARWPNRSLGFGYGRHYCLGAELARLEMRVALEEALRLLPGLRLNRSRPFKRTISLVPLVTEASFSFDQNAAERCLAQLPQ